MSTLSDWWSDLRALVFPPLCPVCGKSTEQSVHGICLHCRADVPLTHFWEQFDNPLTRRLWGLLPVVHASAFLFFVEGSGWRRLIHGFKYRGAWRSASEMGRWYGSYLSQSGLYSTVDVVVPIPLHWRKRIKRGYNQSEYIAKGVASELGVPVVQCNVVRLRNNPPQATTRPDARWENVQGIFAVRHPDKLKGAHILLVDDVFTTGATIISCAEEILRCVPECRISIAVLAVSHRGLGVDH